MNGNGPHPNDMDAYNCARPLFMQRLQMGPALLSCSDSVQVSGARVIDRKENGGNTDVIAEIYLTAISGMAGQSMAADLCTGSNWNGNIPANARITIVKVLTFQVFLRKRSA